MMKNQYKNHHIIFIAALFLTLSIVLAQPIKNGSIVAYTLIKIPVKKITQALVVRFSRTPKIQLPAEQEDSLKATTHYVLQKDAPKLPISAISYFVGDMETGESILEKTPETERPIASVSKLLTSLVAIELIPQNDFAKVSTKALSTYGENSNFRKGEKV